jgi:hypothetical protein
MVCALRPSWTCASIHARCGSHAEGVIYGGVAFALPASRAGGRGGGISDAAHSEPVATPGEFADLMWRRIVLGSTPVRRSTSRCVRPCFSSHAPPISGVYVSSGWGILWWPQVGDFGWPLGLRAIRKVLLQRCAQRARLLIDSTA